jgi:hypothetical protein
VVRDPAKIPDQPVLMAQTYDAADAPRLAKELVAEYKKQTRDEVRGAPAPKPQALPPEFAPGEVVYHADGYGFHPAVLLATRGDEHLLLFLTSNPDWNPFCRRLGRDEAALTGVPIKRATYFAPVVRRGDISPSGVSFPSHRVASLLAEFFPERRIAQLRYY